MLAPGQALTLNGVAQGVITDRITDLLRAGGAAISLVGPQIGMYTDGTYTNARITGIEPVGVKSLDDLDDYIGRCKDYYQGASQEARFLRWLLDEERSRCLCAA